MSEKQREGQSWKMGRIRQFAIGLTGITATAGLMMGGLGNSASAQTATPPPLNFLTAWDYNAGMTDANYGTVSSNLGGLVDMPLAMWLQDNLQYYPMIASNWKLQGKTLTIHIRPNARWSNGQPVTANDVAMSIELGGYVFGQAYSPYLKSVDVVNSKEVRVTETKPYPFFTRYVLGFTNILPYSEYHSMVPPNLVNIYQKSLGQGKAAAAATTKLSALDKKIVGYKKNYFVGEGPYKIQSVTTAQAELVPNPYFYGASKVHVPEIVAYNVPGNTQAWGYYAANKSDLSSYNGSWTIIHAWQHKPGDTVISPNMFANTALFFNTSIYPFDNVKVRQAIAYLLNRKTISTIAEPVTGFPKNYPVAPFFGLTLKQNMNAADYKQLHKYSVNSAKAASLLESAGFKKTSSGWIMPNGKPFTTSVYSVSGYSDWNTAATLIAAALQKFGIPTQNRVEDGGTYFSNANQVGTGYPMFLDWGANSPFAYFDMTNFLGIYGYGGTTTGGYTHAKGVMSLPTAIKLQNGKTVNIIKEGYDLLHATGTRAKNMVVNIAEAANQQMLADDLWDYGAEIFVSSRNYTGWPSGNNPAWTPANNIAQDQPLALFITEGWLHPVK